MKMQNNVNLNTKSPSFSANAVEILEPGLKALGDAVQRTDLVDVAQAAKKALLEVQGVDSFQVGRHIEIIEPPKRNIDFANPNPPPPDLPRTTVTDDIAVTATRIVENPNPPRRGFWGFFANTYNAFIYPRLIKAVKTVPGAQATVEKLREAGAKAAEELTQLA